MATKNAINANTSGVQRYNGAGTWTASTLTQDGLLYGGASNAISSLAAAASGTIMIGNTAAAPSFTATPSITSITLSGGTAFSRYVEGTYTPTIGGSTLSPTVTYSQQLGRYTRIGNRVTVTFNVVLASTSGGGGNILMTMPFTSANPGGDAIISPCNVANLAYTANSFVVTDITPGSSNALLVNTTPSTNAGVVQVSALTATSGFKTTVTIEV